MTDVLTNTSGRPLSRRGLDTRRRLLDAAEQVFGELGYHDASMVKITEAAKSRHGLGDPYEEHRAVPLRQHVADFAKELEYKGGTAAHRKQVVACRTRTTPHESHWWHRVPGSRAANPVRTS